MIDKITSLQIIGTQRSGSNLLRLMLNQFNEVSAPHPPHVLRTFVPLLKYYGDLTVEENFYSLASDITDFVNANPVTWSGEKLVAAELVTKARHNSILSLYETLYVIKAQHDNASIWCCKSMVNEYYAMDIEAKGIKPFYIYMYRDGRDVAASFKKAIVGPKHIYHIAKKWLEDQEKALQVQTFVGEDRFFSIKYEDLIANPEDVLRALSSKMGLAYTPDLLKYYASNESRRTAASGEMWKNVAKPIIKNNVGKFHQELDVDDILFFENIAGEMLVKLGYPLTTEEPMVQKEYSEEEIINFTEQNKALQKEARQKASKGDLSHRSKQEDILSKIKERLSTV